MSKPASEFLDLPVQTRAADVRPGSFDAEKRTVEVVASTGAMVKRYGWMGEYDEQLVISEQAVDLRRFTQVGAVLDNHNAYGSSKSVLGVPQRAWIENGQLLAELRFDTDPASDEVFQKIGRGILRAVSIGYDAEYERIRAKDREDGGERDLYRSTRLEPYEVSVVMMPADVGAVVRSAPEGATRRYAVRSREEMTMSTQAAPQSPTPEERAKIEKGAQARAFERAAATRTLLRNLALDDTKAEALVQAHDDENALRSAVLAMAEERQKNQNIGGAGAAVRVEVGRSAADKQTEAMALALMHRTLRSADQKKVRALNEKLKDEGRKDEITPDLGDDDMPRRFMRARLIDLAATFLESRGINTTRMSPNDIALGALHFRGAGGGLATTSDFSAILAAGANKMLAIGYQEVTSPWREFARRVDRPDFKQFSIFRRSGAPNLEVVNEHGEVKRASFNVGTPLTGQLATAGIEVGFTRQMLVNDDLDAFSQQSLGLGESAVRFEDDAIVTDILYGNPTLADGTTFFHTDRGNVSADTGAPDLNALLAVMRLFELMTETIKKAGNNAGTTTRKLMFKLRGFLGASTEIAAIDQILQPRFPDAAANALPRALTGASTWQDSRLAVEANPPDVWFGISTRNAFVYGGLQGDPSPRLSSMAAASTDGTIWQLIHDWYGAVEDPKAIIRVPKS